MECWTICDKVLSGGHTLIAGTTGSGKSVFANSILWSLEAYEPNQKSFWGIDLKRVELARWRYTANCIEIATEPEAAMSILDDVNATVDLRFSRMEEMGLRQYYGGCVYLVIDELAELISVDKRAIVDKLSRIMRLGRAANVFVIAFTQNPSRTGGLNASICQNFTQAIALRCRSSIESRQVIGVTGAELLPKHGGGIMWSSDGIGDIAIPMTADEDICERIRQRWKANDEPAESLESLESLESSELKKYSATKWHRKKKKSFWNFL